MRAHESPAAAAIYALVLAAGRGRRFGGDKLLAPFRGATIIGHVAATLAQAMGGGLLTGGVAVVPVRARALLWPLDTAGLEVVENPEAGTGLASSLRLGLAALAHPDRRPAAAAALVVLADQPLLRLPVIEALVSAWRRAPGTHRPRYADQPAEPGHPVLLDRAAWNLAEALRGDQGLGALLAGHAGVGLVEVPGANPDVDTAEDLRLLEDMT
ncbi:MAG: nucleotidyltransferase family protein [Gemmatimonadota bacterium]|nr:nucleotidyltransferase family protein [Gemmatimonadota bacterium]